MRRCGRRLSLLAWVVLVLVAALALTSAQATGAARDRQTCTTGASSVRATVVDGRIVASEPATTGCIP
jgi:uncharacterized membrane protein YdfJ with MMPL/SSD domain